LLAIMLGAAFAAGAGAQDGIALADPAARGFDPAKLAAIRPTMEADVAAGVTSGEVLLVAKGGDVVLLESVGVQAPGSDTPMSAETIFPICSMTKPIVSVAAMMLVEEGMLSLDDPVAKYIPELADARVLEDGGTRPVATPITVRHLLSHTSGIVYSFLHAGSPIAAAHAEAGLGAAPPAGASTQDFARLVASAPLLSDPGVVWNYGYSVDVLGAVVEVATGQSLEAALKARIFDPLGMTDTAFVQPEENRARLASSGAAFCSPEPFTPTTYFSGGGGLTSTAADYLRFASMLVNDGELDGVRIIKPETLDLMATDIAPQGSASSPFWPGEGMGFGLGFSVVVDEAARPEGQGTIAWWGFEGTHFWVDRKNDVLAVFLALHPADALPAAALERQARVREQVYGALAE
jgi:CubicO group peptidase (beta-lactamase class C family)